MFRRRSTTLAGALLAAALLLAPARAQAQMGLMLSGSGDFFNVPVPLPYNPLFGLPPTFTTVTPRPAAGAATGLPASVVGMYPSVFYYGDVTSPYMGASGMYRPLTGFTGYGTFVAPLNYAGYNFVLFPHAFGTYGYGFAPFMGAYAGIPIVSGPPAPNQGVNAMLSPVRGTAVASTSPRVRPAVYPVVAATASASFARAKVGGAARPAAVEVKLPQADAQLWFQGVKTDRTGAVREFNSPALEPGMTFAYQVRARWTENGQPVERTRMVTVRAGEHVRVDFTTK